VIPLDDERHWYRYHHLFADLLRHYLRLRYPDLIVELHRRASAWYADNQLLDEAVEHALAARLYPRAAHLIEQAGWPMLEQRGEISTLLRWLQRVPDDEIRARPRLCVMYAWLLLLSGQVQVVEQWLSPVGVGPAVPDMEGDDAAFMQGYSAAARAYLAIMQNDLPGAEEHASQALARLPANNQTLRGLLQLFQGGIYRLSGHVRAATEALREASALCEAAGNRLVAVAALSNLAEVQIIQGRLHQAHQIFEQAARLASVQPGRASPLLGRVYIGLGDLLRQWNDLAAATSYLQQSMPLLEAMAATEELVLAYVYLARVKQAHGEPEAACLLIDQAEQLAQNYHLSDVLRWTRINRTCLWLAQGRMAGAMQWIEEQQHASNSIPFPVSSLLDEFDALTRARVLIARGHDDGAALQEALALLNQLHHAALEAGRSGTLIGILVLQSLALEARGERQAALAALERAIRLAEPEGYVRIFVDEGAPMAGLLFAYGRSQPEGTSRRRYIEQLLRAFGEGSTQRPPPSIARSASAEAGLGEDLSERELEILRLLAAGRSNQEIGRALLIAEGTVKKHTHNIFGKLEVRGRTQAVLRAGELGLV
jgi:LuxR family maltose regulon positive regulatory protein